MLRCVDCRRFKLNPRHMLLVWMMGLQEWAFARADFDGQTPGRLERFGSWCGRMAFALDWPTEGVDVTGNRIKLGLAWVGVWCAWGLALWFAKLLVERHTGVGF